MGGPQGCYRGRCMALFSAMKNATKTQTEREFRILERQLQLTPTLPLLKKIVNLRATLSELALGQVEKAMTRLRQLFYDKGPTCRPRIRLRANRATDDLTPQRLHIPSQTSIGISTTTQISPTCLPHLTFPIAFKSI